VYCISLKTILNVVHPIKGFVYESVRFSRRNPNALEALVLPRLHSRPRSSGCGRQRPGYDQLPTRSWLLPPLWTLNLVLVYPMRRVACPTCGVVVEQVPWSSGKHQLTESFRLFLAHWARKLAWEEVARCFRVSWADVYAAVAWVVEYGLKHRVLGTIRALGVDEVCVRVGWVFWSLIYQIDAGMVRLLWIGKDRTKATFQQGLDALGAAACAGLRYVCSDLWQPYLEVVRERLPQVLHILDRFHIRQLQNKAVDQIRKCETRALACAGLRPTLKKLRWALLKNRQHWTPKERRRMRELARSGLASVRAYWLVAAFDHFWHYNSATWAGKFLTGWCRRVARSRLEPLKKVARTLQAHQEVLLNYFRARKTLSSGIVEGMNNKVKLTFRKSYGFRTDHARQLALYHALGKLPEPQITHKFF
jgi:transposase